MAVIMILIWILVGLFWLTVAVLKPYINRSEARAELWKARGDKVAFAIFDGIEWFWTKVLRRKTLKLPAYDLNDADDLARWLMSYGVRSHWHRNADGAWEVDIHEDDKDNLAALFSEHSLPPPGYTGWTDALKS